MADAISVALRPPLRTVTIRSSQKIAPIAIQNGSTR